MEERALCSWNIVLVKMFEHKSMGEQFSKNGETIWGQHPLVFDRKLQIQSLKGFVALASGSCVMRAFLGSYMWKREHP